jgi:hypothetical protein
MATDTLNNALLVTLDRLAGTYAGERLSIDVQSLGHGAGLQLTWQWGGPTRDVGLIGMTGDGRLVLSFLSNSQPWWSQGFLRSFIQEEAIVAADATQLRFKWEATEQPRAEVERMLLEFEDHNNSMTFTYEINGANATRRKWDLRRV